MTEAEPSGHVQPPLAAPSPSRFSASPTLEELFPPVQPVPSFWRRHRRGLFVGFAMLAVAVAVVAYQVRGETRVTHVRVGDCLIGEPGDDAATVEAGQIVDCDKPHTGEVYAIGSTDEHVSLLPAPLDPEIVRICRTEVDRKVLETLAAGGNLRTQFFISTDRTGKVICAAFGPERAGSDLNPSG